METPDHRNVDNSGFSTIQRWHYIVLANPVDPICALGAKSRRDAGVPRSLTKQVRHRLARQAERNSLWTYTHHHNALLSSLKERERASPPRYSTVRRYLRSISQDIANAKIAKLDKLENLVAHLKDADCAIHFKSLADSATSLHQHFCAQVSAAPAAREGLNPQPPTRLQVCWWITSRILLQYWHFHSADGSLAILAQAIWPSWAPRSRTTQVPNRTKALLTRKQVLEIFHNQPRTYGINRTTGRMHGLTVVSTPPR